MDAGPRSDWIACRIDGDVFELHLFRNDDAAIRILICDPSPQGIA